MTLPTVTMLTASEAWGGTELHTWHLARELSGRGHAVRILQMGHRLYDREPRTPGITVHAQPPGRQLDRSAWRAIVGPSAGIVVQVKGGFGLAWPAMDRAVLGWQRQVLRIEHSVAPPRNWRQRLWPGSALHARLHRRAASRILTVADVVREGLVRDHGYDPARIEVITNGVDSVRFQFDPALRAQVRHEWGIDDERFVFGTVTRLAPVKRLDRLLRAFAALSSVPAPSHLVIAGEGPDAAALDQLAASLGISERCRWIGVTERVPAVLSGFDAFVLTSHTESVSYALLEAMAMERPVVAMSVTGVPEVMRDQVFGRLTTEDTGRFSEAMAEVRGWPPERQRAAGAAARCHVLEHHDGQRQTERVADWVVAAAAA